VFANLIFEWDEEKSQNNFRKHKVSFEEAKSVFNDPFALTIQDPKHSIGEYRYIDIGYSSKGRILVVAYSERRSNIRIISCRRATKLEQRVYEKGNI
jgi:hypothetical protein